MEKPAQSPIQLSVMIPVRNEERFIEGTLARLYQQSLEKALYEVIVVDGRSTDGTREAVDAFSNAHTDMNLRLLDNPNKLSSSARNIGARQAQGEYVLLIDGHVYIDTDDLLKNYLELATQNKAKVLGRPQPLSPPGISEFQKSLSIIRGSKLAHSGESFIYSEFEGWTSPISIGVMYHRSIFEEIGYFDENFDAAEDFEFNYRLEKAGLECFTSPKLQVYYYPRENIRGLFKQLHRYGYGRALFISKHPERLTIETLIPACFVLFLASLLPSWLIADWIAMSLAAVYLFYLSLVCLEGLRLSLKHKSNLFFKAVSIIHTIHIGLGYGFLKGLIIKLIRLSKKNQAGDRI